MEEIGHGPHVFRAGAATAPDPLRAGAPPPSRQFAKLLYLSVAMPAVMHRIPLLAGVGIDDDGLICDLCKLADEAADQLGTGAIDADPDDLRLLIEQFRARPQGLSVGNVRSIRQVKLRYAGTSG